MTETNNSDDYECNHRSLSESSSVICLKCYLETTGKGVAPVRFRKRKENEADR